MLIQHSACLTVHAHTCVFRFGPTPKHIVNMKRVGGCWVSVCQDKCGPLLCSAWSFVKLCCQSVLIDDCPQQLHAAAALQFFLQSWSLDCSVLHMLSWSCEQHSMLQGAVLYCAVLCCAVHCCAVLCCAVLCCAVLCCAVLCCAGIVPCYAVLQCCV